MAWSNKLASYLSKGIRLIQQMLLWIIKLVNFCSSFEVFAVDFAFFQPTSKPCISFPPPSTRGDFGHNSWTVNCINQAGFLSCKADCSCKSEWEVSPHDVDMNAGPCVLSENGRKDERQVAASVTVLSIPVNDNHLWHTLDPLPSPPSPPSQCSMSLVWTCGNIDGWKSVFTHETTASSINSCLPDVNADVSTCDSGVSSYRFLPKWNVTGVLSAL